MTDAPSPLCGPRGARRRGEVGRLLPPIALRNPPLTATLPPSPVEVGMLETMMTMTPSEVLAVATLSGGVVAIWFLRKRIGAWLRALLGLHRQVVRLDALEAAVADLKRRKGVRPADLRIVGGAVWGRIGSDEEFHPFCPWCASKDSWTLLVREDERGNESFRCISCHRHIPSGHLMPPTIR